MGHFLSALRVAWRTAPAGARVRGLLLAGGLCVGLVGAGGLLSRGLFPRLEVRETTHNHVVYQEKAVVQVVEKPVDRWRTVTHTEYDPACHSNEIKSTTVTEEHVHSDGSITQVAVERAADSTTDTERITKPVEGRGRVGVLGGLGTGGGYAGGLEGSYRLIGPLELGGAAIGVVRPGQAPEVLILLEAGWRF